MVDWGGNLRVPGKRSRREELYIGVAKDELVLRRLEYREVAQNLEERISAGEWADGALPSVRNLQEEYRVGRSTVLRAIGLLKQQDVVFTVPRRGTYVKQETDK
jgi:DNA-binding GntR family transcriptional regulator